MRKRFIVLIDFSEGSANLIKYACDWGLKADADILLVHRTTVVDSALMEAESRRRIAQRANEEAGVKLKALAKDLVPQALKVNYAVSERHLELTLTELLAQAFQDLVFVGVKETGLVKKLVIGSVALDVLNNTGNCLVAMPKEIDAFSQSSIHVSVTEKYPLNILELNNYLKFLDDQQMKLHFFHLAAPHEDTQGIEKQLRELSELFAHRFETDFVIFEGADPLKEIKGIVKNRADEVLVVQRGSRLLTDRLFRRFLIDELVCDGQTPLVVLP